jgi:hypothetical protein
MMKTTFKKILLLTILSLFCLSAAAAPDNNLAEVMFVNTDKDMEKIKKSYPEPIEVTLPPYLTGSDVFAIRPLIKPFGISVYEVEYNNGSLERTARLFQHYIEDDNAFILRIILAEGTPNLEVAVYGESNGLYSSFYLSYNGVSEALALDGDGFKEWD